MNILKDTNSLSQTAISRFFLDTELQCILESGKKIFLKKDEVLFEENSFQETGEFNCEVQQLVKFSF